MCRSRDVSSARDRCDVTERDGGRDDEDSGLGRDVVSRGRLRRLSGDDISAHWYHAVCCY